MSEESPGFLTMVVKYLIHPWSTVSTVSIKKTTRNMTCT